MNKDSNSKDNWFQKMIEDYKKECDQLREIVANKENRDQNQNYKDAENKALLNELLLKKDRVDELQNENRNLAEKYLSEKENKHYKKNSYFLLEEMIKDKNQVSYNVGNCIFKTSKSKFKK